MYLLNFSINGFQKQDHLLSQETFFKTKIYFSSFYWILWTPKLFNEPQFKTNKITIFLLSTIRIQGCSIMYTVGCSILDSRGRLISNNFLIELFQINDHSPMHRSVKDLKIKLMLVLKRFGIYVTALVLTCNLSL